MPRYNQLKEHKACQRSWDSIKASEGSELPRQCPCMPIPSLSRPGCLQYPVLEHQSQTSTSLAPKHRLQWGRKMGRRKRFLPRKGGRSRKTDSDYLTRVQSGLSHLRLHAAVFLVHAALKTDNRKLKPELVSSASSKPSATLTCD